MIEVEKKSGSAGVGGGQTLYDAIVAPSGGDYTDIQSAINAGKHKLFVRAGTYTLSADIVFAADETVIIGESWDTIIACGASYKIDMSSRSNCVIDGIKVTGTRTDTGSIYQATAGDNNTIRGCLLDCSYGIKLTTGHRHKVIGNYITGANGRYGIYINGGYGEGIISNNIIYDFGTTTSAANVYGIYASNYNSITGNTLQNLGNSSANYVVGIRGYAKNTVTGNTLVKLNSKATSGGTIYGIFFDDGYNVASENIFHEIGHVSSYKVYGIYSNNSYNVASANTLYSVGNASSTNTYGIHLLNLSVIIGNDITNLNAKIGGNVYNISAGYASNVSGNMINITSVNPTTYGVYLSDNYAIASGNNIMHTVAVNYPIYVATGKMVQTYNNMGANATEERKAVYAKNTSGAEVVAGGIVTIKAVASGNEFTTTTAQGDDLVYGMATATIANNASNYIQILGKTTKLKVNGVTDIAIGDFIGTFTTAGIGMKAGTGDMAIAIALEAYTTNDSAGVIDALLISPRKI